MLKHQLIQKKSNHQRQKDRKGKFYSRVIILIYLFLSGTLLQVFPALAASLTRGTVIDKQATGSFIDSTDSTEKQIESNTVKVTVAEVAGITITPANTPSVTTGSVVNFDFTVTNVGNDPTQFFMMAAYQKQIKVLPLGLVPALLRLILPMHRMAIADVFIQLTNQVYHHPVVVISMELWW